MGAMAPMGGLMGSLTGVGAGRAAGGLGRRVGQMGMLGQMGQQGMGGGEIRGKGDTDADWAKVGERLRPQYEQSWQQGKIPGSPGYEASVKQNPNIDPQTGKPWQALSLSGGAGGAMGGAAGGALGGIVGKQLPGGLGGAGLGGAMGGMLGRILARRQGTATGGPLGGNLPGGLTGILQSLPGLGKRANPGWLTATGALGGAGTPAMHTMPYGGGMMGGVGGGFGAPGMPGNSPLGPGMQQFPGMKPPGELKKAEEY